MMKLNESNPSRDCESQDMLTGELACSGRGFCSAGVGKNSSTPLCVCDSGWQATGDFSSEPYYCDQHILTLKIIWGNVAVLNIILCIYMIGNLYIQFRILSSKGKRKYGKTVFLSCAILSSSADFFLGMNKAFTNNDRKIGADTLITGVFCVSMFLFFLASGQFTVQYMHAMHVSAKQNLVTTESSERFSTIFLALGLTPIILFFFPLWLCSVNGNNDVLSAKVFYGTLAYVAFGNQVVLLSFINALLKQITEHVESLLLIEEQKSKGAQFDELLKNLKYERNLLWITFVVIPFCLLTIAAPADLFRYLVSYVPPAILPLKTLHATMATKTLCFGDRRRSKNRIRPKKETQKSQKKKTCEGVVEQQ